MPKLEKYNSYKNSGVEWLGDIPEHWEVKKLKYLSAIKTGYTPDTTKSENYSEDGIVWVKPDELREFNLIIDSKEKINKNRVKKQNIIQKDSILVNCIGNIGKFGIAGIELVTNQQINSVTFNSYIYNKFGKYLIFVSKDEHFKHSNGNVVQILNVSSQSQIILPIPPKEEQEKIANYLDDKTAQIDEAISQKQKLIELLKERKQIVINDAVTKGVFESGTFLNSCSARFRSKAVPPKESGAKAPPSELKDSGVEWIGQIPKHWEIRRFKNYFKFDKGLTITKENLQDEGIFCVNYGEIHSKFGFEVNPKIDNLKCVSEEYLKNNQKSLVNSGDFIFADTSEDIEGSGNFTYLNSDLITFAGYHTIICRPKNDLISRFLAYEFESITFRSQIQKRVKGVKVYSITQGLLKDLIIWLPPKKEQLQILEYIENQTIKIDKAIELEQNYIEKLKEYKATLIDSVVTGKVRVS